jgi:starvation-inducible DNA-binding protein
MQTDINQSQINIGISIDGVQQIAGLLNAILADEFNLRLKTKNFHWNVTGPHFSEYHKLLDDQAEMLEEIIDDTAERVRALNVHSVGSMEEYLEHTRLTENTGRNVQDQDMLKELLSDHEAIIRQLRKDIETCEQLGDAGNADYLTATMEAHEKMAWMLRASAVN